MRSACRAGASTSSSTAGAPSRRTPRCGSRCTSATTLLLDASAGGLGHACGRAHRARARVAQEVADLRRRRPRDASRAQTARHMRVARALLRRFGIVSTTHARSPAPGGSRVRSWPSSTPKSASDASVARCARSTMRARSVASLANERQDHERQPEFRARARNSSRCQRLRNVPSTIATPARRRDRFGELQRAAVGALGRIGGVQALVQPGSACGARASRPCSRLRSTSVRIRIAPIPFGKSLRQRGLPLPDTRA